MMRKGFLFVLLSLVFGSAVAGKIYDDHHRHFERSTVVEAWKTAEFIFGNDTLDDSQGLLMMEFAAWGRYCPKWIMDTTDSVPAYWREVERRQDSLSLYVIGLCWMNRCDSVGVSRAMGYLARASEAGMCKAKYMLALCYEYISYEDALPYMLSAVSCGGCPEAELRLAHYYEKGLGGLTKDERHALEIYSKLAASDEFAVVELSRCYRKGIGIKKNKNVADSLLQSADCCLAYYERSEILKRKVKSMFEDDRLETKKQERGDKLSYLEILDSPSYILRHDSILSTKEMHDSLLLKAVNRNCSDAVFAFCFCGYYLDIHRYFEGLYDGSDIPRRNAFLYVYLERLWPTIDDDILKSIYAELVLRERYDRRDNKKLNPNEYGLKTSSLSEKWHQRALSRGITDEELHKAVRKAIRSYRVGKFARYLKELHLEYLASKSVMHVLLCFSRRSIVSVCR